MSRTRPTLLPAYVDADRLDGLPRVTVRAGAASRCGWPTGATGYKLSLLAPRFQPVMQYATDRALRERLYRAFHTRASDLGSSQYDNSTLMTELLELRQENAKLLQFADYAQLSLATKMARTPAQVLQFLRDLAARSHARAQDELTDMREFARAQLGIEQLMPWDHRFVAERLREQRFAFSDQERQTLLHVRARARRAVSRLSRRCSSCASRPTRPRCGTTACASIASSATAS